MIWFWLSLAALLCWSGSDLLSKLGCQGEDDRLSHLRMVSAVGLIMGLHAAYEVFLGGTAISWQIILRYLPVSAFYISSMAVGYLGMRYIELSISSPICNSSGALVVVLCLITDGIGSLVPLQLAAVALVCVGVIGLGVVEAREDETLRSARQDASSRHYSKSWLALALPILYCLLDTCGTFADSRIIETMNEDSANVAYELTFFAVGAVCKIYTDLIRKQKPVFRLELPKLGAAVFETAGQFAYIHAIADSGHVALSVPIISAYCVVSMLWGRIFLKEKLSGKHYLMIGLVVIGIIIMGIFDT